jgi:protein transport protein SEC20
MDTSKQLITALEKSDWLDRVLILSGLFFFLLVVLFILKQRIFDRGMRIAFWWTRFVPDFSGDEQLLSMEKGAAATLSSVVNSASVVTSGVVSITSSAASVASAILAGSASTSVLDPEPTPDSEPESTLDVDSSETLHAPIQVDTAHVEL